MTNRKGFSLIEVLISFMILTITVIASVSLLSASIRNNQENILRLQAYNLAQQGLEGIRNIRDSNWTQNQGFTNTSNSLWGEANIYPGASSDGEINILIEPIINASIPTSGTPWRLKQASTSNSDLYLDQHIDGTKFFTHTPTETTTPFRRIIKITKNFEDLDKIQSETEAISDDLIVVTSTVYYDFRGREKELAISTILTDWKEGPL
jgi:type II secretory pathway pseudopilin PulG